MQFGGRLASVSSVLSGVSDDLGAGLDNLDSAVADVKRFLDERGGQLTESVQNLAQVTQILADKRPQLEQVLHSGPVALANFYQIYKPAQGTLTGAVVLPNFRNPFAFLCGAVEALEDNGSQRTADLCKQQVAPVISSLMMNYPPLLVNPASGQQAFPSQLTFSPRAWPTASSIRRPARLRPRCPAVLPAWRFREEDDDATRTDATRRRRRRSGDPVGRHRMRVGRSEHPADARCGRNG